jgi:hypothetical protein
MKKWKAIRDNIVRCHRQMTQTETGMVFHETLKSNAKSPKFIPEAKYLKKSRKVE